ncbi:MAG: DUF501 domain-containing protein [Planctomycetota bacterium]
MSDEPQQEEPRVLAAQMGRPLRGRSRIARRCPLELPVVIRTHPVLPSGAPFPTLYYLTCPLARTRISRLEHEGGVRAFQERAEREPDFARALDAAHAAYAAERAAALAPDDPALPRLRGGVGGTVGGVKCLHMHYAHHAGGGANPVGAEVAAAIEPLDCSVPCVVDGARNPAWREPRAP